MTALVSPKISGKETSDSCLSPLAAKNSCMSI